MKSRRLLVAAALLVGGAMALAAEPVVAPPDSLVLDGVPPVAVDLADAVGRYAAPELDSIRSSPRFRDLVRRFDFPQPSSNKN